MNPSPKQIKAARKRSLLTQKQAGALIGYSMRAWQAWEGGHRKMRKILLDEFLRITGNMLK